MATEVSKFHFRLVLLGSNRTGKTSILNRFLFKKFELKYKPTVEDLFCKEFDIGSIEIKVDFLDTSGSMQFPAMRRLSITTGSAFLIVYAIDDLDSFEVLKMCIAEIQEIRPDFQEIPIVFAGNKTDLPPEDRKITKESVSNYVHYELPRLRAKVIECSCKESSNIDNIFRSYLSLAKVNLLPAAPISLKNRKGSSSSSTNKFSRPLSNEQIDEGDECQATAIADTRRSSSMKVALGIRKSCDASIITSMKNVSITVTPEEHRNILSSSRYVPSTGPRKICSLSRQPVDEYQNCQIPLDKAIRSKLNQSHDPSAKPRSRSLIWRPSRKVRTSSSPGDQDCRVI